MQTKTDKLHRQALQAAAIVVLVVQAGFAGGFDFDRHIRPILSDKCFQCHGPDEGKRESELRLDSRERALKGGRSGYPAIVPGDRGESEVWALISSEFDEERMPPKEAAKQLTAEEIEVLGRWIDEGAPWAEHWSFVAPQRPSVPVVDDGGWSRGAEDRFLWRRMAARGFRP